MGGSTEAYRSLRAVIALSALQQAAGLRERGKKGEQTHLERVRLSKARILLKGSRELLGDCEMYSSYSGVLRAAATAERAVVKG